MRLRQQQQMRMRQQMVDLLARLLMIFLSTRASGTGACKAVVNWSIKRPSAFIICPLRCVACIWFPSACIVSALWASASCPRRYIACNWFSSACLLSARSAFLSLNSIDSKTLDSCRCNSWISAIQQFCISVLRTASIARTTMCSSAIRCNSSLAVAVVSARCCTVSAIASCAVSVCSSKYRSLCGS